jgi:DNA helicase IV
MPEVVPPDLSQPWRTPYRRAVDWRRGAGVLVTTARTFKGLEADVVIAYGLAAFGALFTPTDLYVAWTRARHRRS